MQLSWFLELLLNYHFIYYIIKMDIEVMVVPSDYSH